MTISRAVADDLTRSRTRRRRRSARRFDRTAGNRGRGAKGIARALGRRAFGGRTRLDRGSARLGENQSGQSARQALDLPFRRVPFTPDLLPADLTGTQIYRPSTGEFDIRLGPIVTGVLLADEINRAPSKVQSALLEAMQDGQVTIGDRTIPLPNPFYVLATQNPIEHEGTYPLPEAQLDRFLMKLRVGYPERAAELAMLDLPSILETVRDDPPPLFGAAETLALRAKAGAVRVAPSIKEYVVDLIRATRDPSAFGLDVAPLIELGASPRGTLSLVRAGAPAPCFRAEITSHRTTSRLWRPTSCVIASSSAMKPRPTAFPPTTSSPASSTTSRSPKPFDSARNKDSPPAASGAQERSGSHLKTAVVVARVG